VQNPCKKVILQNIIDAHANSLQIDDFDKDRYAQYSAAYDDRYLNRGWKDIFFDALEYPDEEFGTSTVGDTPFSSVRGILTL
jgi:hypothetical protein